ncbi:MAG: hypothetical protein JSS86_02805 [Cyanobacteria bacterium SZAS LIN-2]|nr:hypothetical protein [Cyanobacteria bacterium SZAS LIN-3]MBS1995206.1 hypothetical protein [Cyanobacteria bacterium SZAS LIN-2]
MGQQHEHGHNHHDGHDQGIHKQEKNDHQSLVHALSPADWQAHKTTSKPAGSGSAHLPNTEIVGLKHTLTDGHKTTGERLAAAHKLALSQNKDLTERDGAGKPLHLRISASGEGNKTHIVVSRIDGTGSRPYLDGLVDKNGREITNKTVAAGTNNEHVRHSVHHRHSEGAHHQRSEERDHGGNGTRRGNEREYAGSIASTSDYGYRTAAPANCSSDTSAYISPDLASGDINTRFARAEALTGSASDRMIQLPDGTVYMRTHLRVDADGGPDWSSDRFGQAGTSLRNSDGRPLNAKEVNYFVLPLGEKWKRMGVKLSDIAWVRNTQNGKIVPAIFGDQGPSGKLGEGSQGLCRALGLSDNPNHGGTDQKCIEFVIVPHSGTGTGDIARSPELMASRLGARGAGDIVA